MRGMGCASFTVAALSCLKSTQNRNLPSFFFTMMTGEAQGLLEGWMMPNSGVLVALRLAERRSFGLYGVLQERCAAQIVLSLAHSVTEFLEEVPQLMLLGG